MPLLQIRSRELELNIGKSDQETRVNFKELSDFLKKQPIEFIQVAKESSKLSRSFKELTKKLEFEILEIAKTFAISERALSQPLPLKRDPNRNFNIWFDHLLNNLVSICNYYRSTINFEYTSLQLQLLNDPIRSENCISGCSEILTFVCNIYLFVTRLQRELDTVTPF